MHSLKSFALTVTGLVLYAAFYALGTLLCVLFGLSLAAHV